jgi:hypothetical protein
MVRKNKSKYQGDILVVFYVDFLSFVNDIIVLICKVKNVNCFFYRKSFQKISFLLANNQNIFSRFVTVHLNSLYIWCE